MLDETKLFPTKRHAKVIYLVLQVLIFFTSHPYSPCYYDLVLNFIYASILEG
jgi:hypothetical protein